MRAYSEAGYRGFADGEKSQKTTKLGPEHLIRMELLSWKRRRPRESRFKRKYGWFWHTRHPHGDVTLAGGCASRLMERFGVEK